MDHNNGAYEKILPVAEAYNTLYTEYKAILKEIQSFKQRFQGKQKELKKKMSELEKSLIEFMVDNNHPGIRYKEILLLKEEKGSMKLPQKKQKILDTLRRANVTPVVEQQIRDILDQKTPDTRDIKLKVIANSAAKEG